MKRKLNEKEMLISTRNLKRLKEELQYNLYQVNICDLKIDGGLMIEYLKQIRDYRKLRIDYKAEVEMLKGNVNTLQSQIRDGVEIIEEKVIEKKDIEEIEHTNVKPIESKTEDKE